MFSSSGWEVVCSLNLMENLPSKRNWSIWSSEERMQRTPVVRKPSPNIVAIDHHPNNRDFIVFHLTKWSSDSAKPIQFIEKPKVCARERKRKRKIAFYLYSFIFFSPPHPVSRHRLLCAFISVIFNSLIIMCGLTSIKNLSTFVHSMKTQWTVHCVSLWEANWMVVNGITLSRVLQLWHARIII